MASPLIFSVRRRETILVAPETPTPHEFKHLSECDKAFCSLDTGILFYKCNPSLAGRDPVLVTKQSIAKALVPYYPLAGRLRKSKDRGIVVECTGEGVLFIEADADVSLEQFGTPLTLPFPCFEELLYDVDGSMRIIDSPLYLIQVTRLKCGGFVFAYLMNHAMNDGVGVVQFLNAIAELACGASQPSITPVWARELLYRRTPPRITCVHRYFDENPTDPNSLSVPSDNIQRRSFLFSDNEINAIRTHLPPKLNSRTSPFQVLCACLWKCRTVALGIAPNDEVRLAIAVDGRRKLNPPLPVGYYGNALGASVAYTTAAKLGDNTLGYVVELIKKAKSAVTDEFMRSQGDLMALKNRPRPILVRTFTVSDVTGLGATNVDFGWGKPVYTGVTKLEVGGVPGYGSFLVPFRKQDGSTGISVTLSLPAVAISRFVAEIDSFIKMDGKVKTPKIPSAL